MSLADADSDGTKVGAPSEPLVSRRKGLDRAREVEAESAHEGATREAEEKATEWQEERREVGTRVLASQEANGPASPVRAAPPADAKPFEQPSPAAPSALSADASSSASNASTLRRVKQLEPTQAEAIERECGVRVKPTSDIFRLVMKNATSTLYTETSVLLVTINDSFLCEAPPREVADEASGVDVEAAEARLQGPGKRSDDEEGGGIVEVELFFFRSKVMPSVGGKSTGSLAKKLDKVPVLQVTVLTSDGLSQAFEFLGVHQRQYYVQNEAPDAIARNLDESLLKVVLEFIFHPSRSRYTREHLVLRECGASAEAIANREELLPYMARQIQSASTKIQTVSIEYASQRVLDVSKGRSMLVVDERMLEVAFAKAGAALAKAPSSTFSGFGRGFLSAAGSKKRPATARGERKAQEALAGSASSAAASAASPTLATAASASSAGAEEPAENLAVPSATSKAEKQDLLLPAGDLSSQLSEDVRDFAQGVEAGSLGARQAAEELDEDGQDDQAVPSLSDLARQLFGDGDLDLDNNLEVGFDELTDSTGTPSLEASGVGAPSEHSESQCTEDGFDSGEIGNSAGGVGLRLLQQRRRRLPEQEGTGGQRTAQDQEADELVALWMKQRW